MTDPLQNTKIDLHPHTITMNAGARLAKLVQTYVTSSGVFIDMIHEIHCPDRHGKIGYYRVCMHYKGARTSHIFDIELLLDMRDTWREHVKTKTEKLIADLT